MIHDNLVDPSAAPPLQVRTHDELVEDLSNPLLSRSIPTSMMRHLSATDYPGYFDSLCIVLWPDIRFGCSHITAQIYEALVEIFI